MGGDVGAKNGDGDVEIAWDSSEVGADTEIEYVPLVRVEHPSLPSPQPNIVPLNQRTIEGISIPRDPWVWNNPTFNKFVICWFATWWVLDLATDGGGMGIFFGFVLFPFILYPRRLILIK